MLFLLTYVKREKPFTDIVSDIRISGYGQQMQAL
jgi:hypothetical protein